MYLFSQFQRQLALCAFALWAATSVFAEWTVARDGHLDLRFLYEEGEGLLIRIVDVASSQILETDTYTIRVEGTNTIQTRPTGGVWDASGVAPGESFWVLPQTQDASIPWLGTRAQIGEGIFRPLPPAPVFGTGQLSLRLVSVEGSGVDAGGVFTLFSSDAFGFPTFSWTTEDGIDGSDLVAPINTNSHTHFNWSFTQPGDYLVAMEVSGYTLENNRLLTAQATMHFQVLPPETASVEGLLIQSRSGNVFLGWPEGETESSHVVWQSSDLIRWWVEAVLPSQSSSYTPRSGALSNARFWRMDDPAATDNSP